MKNQTKLCTMLFPIALSFTSSPSCANALKTNFEISEEKAKAVYQLRVMQGQESLLNTDTKTFEKIFNQKIDHTNSEDTRTFKQRYWTYSNRNAEANAPVFYMICGESRCGGIQPYYYAYALANKFKGHVVALEHRYYGDSQPFKELTPENLQYLSTDAALQDLAELQTHLTQTKNWNGPWITLGGSYAGALSAYYRAIYPELAVGALASSGPVEAKATFEEYDETVTVGLGKDCANKVREVVNEIESSLDNEEKMASIKALFKASDIKNNTNFLFAVADMASGAVQYGDQAQFCRTLESASDALTGYAKAGLAILRGAPTKESTFEGAETIDSADYKNSAGWRQWTWQFCTEYGYFQTANENPELSTRSSLLTREFHDLECARLFGTKPLDTSKINKKYFEPLLDTTRSVQVSNIFFTNGSNDPWKNLSLTEERGNNTNSLLSYKTIQNAAHCDDFFANSSNPYVTQAHGEFEALVSSWIKEFENK